MTRLIKLAVIGGGALALAACGSSDDASTEAMPETVELPADTALEPIAEEPVEDAGIMGPEEPESTAPDPVTTAETADRAAEVAAEAAAAAEAAEAAASIPVE